MADRLLTLAEIARRLDLPESTARYYRNKFATFIPSVGEGRKRRYRPEALDVLRIIAESMDRNLTATEIEERLSRDFARNIETATGPQPTAATTPQQPSICNYRPFYDAAKAFQQVAAALERPDRNGRSCGVAERSCGPTAQLDDQDPAECSQDAGGHAEQTGRPRRRWWWPFGEKKGRPMKDGDIKNFDLADCLGMQ